MVEVLNRQRRVKVDVERLRALFGRVVRAAGVEKDVSVVLVSDKKIRELNKRFRGGDRATDCLSFEGDDVGGLLGDIVISVETALRQGIEFQEGASEEEKLMKEIEFLFIHSFLHLLGFDHEREEDKKKMEEEHARIVAMIGSGEGEYDT